MGSYHYAGTPTFEQQWREEVLYLHSLWHKGPPRNARPKPKLNSNCLGASNSTTPKPNSNNLGASSSTKPKLESINLGASTSTTPKPNSISLGAFSSITPEPNSINHGASSSNLGASSSTTPKLDSISLGASSSTTPELNSISLGAFSSTTPKLDSIKLGTSSSTTPKLDSINLGTSSSTAPKLDSINLGASSSTAPKLNSINLGANNLTTFKKRKNKQRRAKKRKDPEPICLEVERPCGPNPEPCQETVWQLWPKSNPQSDQATRPATTEEQAKPTALYLQQKGLKACEDFFSSDISSKGDGEEEDLMDDDVYESEEFKFFLGIFTDDCDLKNYYEKNWERGEFCCLVCAVTGKTKRLKNCVALVQHSTAISKTKRKAAHRAFGKAICQVLGWDIHRLPVIVQSPDGPLGHSISKTESEVGLKQYSAQNEELHKLVDDTEGEVDPKDHGVSIKKEDLQGKVVDFVGAMTDNRLHQKNCDSETVEEMGGHIMGMRWFIG